MPEDMGVSKGKGKDKGTETGKGKGKTDAKYTRFGRRAAPDSSDDSEDLEDQMLRLHRLVLQKERQGQGKGQRQGQGQGQSSKPAAKSALNEDSATNVSA